MSSHDDKAKGRGPHSLIKFAALTVLVLQNASLVLAMRYSQIHPGLDAPLYLASSAVLIGEGLKIIGSFLFLLGETDFNIALAITQIISGLVASWRTRELASLSVPAFLYLVQNNLVYVATANLDPAPFQLLFQLKIFTTAILSVLLLKKLLTSSHWWSLTLLFVGVTVVQFSIMDKAASSNDRDQDPLIGLASILVAVTCSGLSGVWFEKILKGSSTSLWIRNIQLGTISFMMALVTVYVKDYNQVASHGILAGYTPVVWLVICLQSGGGLIVAVVVKYTDNILKGFATSIATILSTIASVVWFGFEVKPLFALGAFIVVFSAYLYNRADRAIFGHNAVLTKQNTKLESLWTKGADKV